MHRPLRDSHTFVRGRNLKGPDHFGPYLNFNKIFRLNLGIGLGLNDFFYGIDDLYF